MKQFGLIGYPLGHSYSKDFFTKKFNELELTDHSYDLFPVMSINRVVPLLQQNPDLQGFNVTIPHKQTIIPFLNEVTPVAKKIFAVNTVNITVKKGSLWLTGYNTDYIGFRDSIKPVLKEHHTRALILGTGGSSKAVAYAFEELGIEYLFVSRSSN
ncbi:MAG: shikimate dehydrogenase, partial [Bacteroidia bacterium]|nr:shikimate dehydrogenase [Bacteroidia bacterium]